MPHGKGNVFYQLLIYYSLHNVTNETLEIEFLQIDTCNFSVYDLQKKKNLFHQFLGMF